MYKRTCKLVTYIVHSNTNSRKRIRVGQEILELQVRANEASTETCSKCTLGEYNRIPLGRRRKRRRRAGLTRAAEERRGKTELTSRGWRRRAKERALARGQAYGYENSYETKTKTSPKNEYERASGFKQSVNFMLLVRVEGHRHRAMRLLLR